MDDNANHCDSLFADLWKSIPIDPHNSFPLEGFLCHHGVANHPFSFYFFFSNVRFQYSMQFCSSKWNNCRIKGIINPSHSAYQMCRYF